MQRAIIIKKNLPNLLTIGNLSAGIVSILVAYQGYLEIAVLLVILSMLFDGLDGKAARHFNTQSEFGKELDSLCDIISFGAAPAFIVYSNILYNYGILGVVLTVIFPVAGAIRLARYNTTNSVGNYFSGIPITAAGGILATFTLFCKLIPSYVIISVVIVLSYLMVSNIKFNNFKKLKTLKYIYIIMPTFIIFVIIITVFPLKVFIKIIFSVFCIYAFYGILIALKEQYTKQIEERNNKSNINKSE